MKGISIYNGSFCWLEGNRWFFHVKSFKYSETMFKSDDMFGNIVAKDSDEAFEKIKGICLDYTKK